MDVILNAFTLAPFSGDLVRRDIAFRKTHAGPSLALIADLILGVARKQATLPVEKLSPGVAC
jgi:hypothetical protein